MEKLKDEQTNLIALLALLISTAVFKEDLSRFKLGGTEISLFNIFAVASVAFGTLLYIVIWLNGLHSLKQIIKMKKRPLSVLIVRLSFFIILTIIPFSTLFIASSNWLTSVNCSSVSPDPFDFTYDSNPKNYEESCQNNFVGLILPLLISISVVGAIIVLERRVNKEWYKLSDEQQLLRMQIGEYRMMQAVTGDQKQIDSIQKIIDKLELDFLRKQNNKK